ncbi:hypothetical protein [Burkholderia sp. EMB26]|uniref:hypothetical protein n=1 Tax=Burkholderia sp. EMB26 TaxID=2854261 RepID=UPI00215B39DD|nr:hypothetical protein [Burkholderia sp. EMB26]UVE57662.1 hypothetical protein KU887_19975 [Burkholderia sp. EMB26]
MIDQDKMRALATELRGPCTSWTEQQKLRQAGNAIDLLLAELEAAAADKRDAERWRIVHEFIPEGELWDIGVIVAHENGVSVGNAHAFKSVELIDAALAQRQGEGS